MAAKLLTITGAQPSSSHGHVVLFGSARPKRWNTMTGGEVEKSQPISVDQIASSTSEPAHLRTESDGDEMPPPSTSDVATSKKRKISKPKISPDSRRPSSTPYMHGPAEDVSPLESPTAEKRRNKLGYHRTSVACGHCRRRKIRCLLAPEDVHGRCLNCIRLKKDCHFYPVDQGPGESKARPSGGAEMSTNQSATSDQSSPRTSAVSDSVDDFKSQGQSSQGPYSIHSSKQSSELDFSESPLDGGQYRPHGGSHSLIGGAAPYNSPTFSYAGLPDGRWGTATYFGNQQTISDDPNTQPSSSEYWPPMRPPGSAIFPHRDNISGSLDQQPFFAPPSEHPSSWNAMRSMSVGDAPLAMHQFQQGLPTQRQTVYTNSPYSFNFTTQDSRSGILETSESGLSMTSTPPGILPSQSLTLPSHGLPHGWNTYADQTTPIAEQNPALFGSHFYAEPPTMGPLDENAVLTTDGEFAPATQPG